MSKLIRRTFDPRVAEPKRIATSVALIVAILVVAGSAAGVVVLRALFLAAASGIAIGATLGVMLQARQDLLREMRELWGLAHVAHDGNPWPAPGGWALGADALGFILREVAARGSHTIVELGPGASSVILGAGAKDLEMSGLEHDPDYVRSLAAQLRMHGVEGYKLVHAPLQDYRSDDGRAVSWYEESALEKLPERIDVLIVDGPPNWQGRGNRSLAWPQLRTRLSDNALVIVDDTFRPDERAMVAAWIRGGGLSLVHDAGSFMALEVEQGGAPGPPSQSGRESARPPRSVGSQATSTPMHDMRAGSAGQHA